MIHCGHGLISLIIHPDYVFSSRAQHIYRQLLEDVCKLQSDDEVWLTLPGEVDRWWRQRCEMKLVQAGSGWIVEGQAAKGLALLMPDSMATDSCRDTRVMNLQRRHALFVLGSLVLVALKWQAIRGLLEYAWDFDNTNASQVFLIPLVSGTLIYWNREAIFRNVRFAPLAGVLTMMLGLVLPVAVRASGAQLSIRR